MGYSTCGGWLAGFKKQSYHGVKAEVRTGCECESEEDGGQRVRNWTGVWRRVVTLQWLSQVERGPFSSRTGGVGLWCD